MLCIVAPRPTLLHPWAPIAIVAVLFHSIKVRSVGKRCNDAQYEPDCLEVRHLYAEHLKKALKIMGCFCIVLLGLHMTLGSSPWGLLIEGSSSLILFSGGLLDIEKARTQMIDKLGLPSMTGPQLVIVNEFVPDKSVQTKR
jgi:hypothetical protein